MMNLSNTESEIFDIVKPELKYSRDVNYFGGGDYDYSNPLIMDPIFAILQGDAYNQRVGNKIVLKQLVSTVTVSYNTNAPDSGWQDYRILWVVIKQDYNDVTIGDIVWFELVSGVLTTQGIYNTHFDGRFDVVADTGLQLLGNSSNSGSLAPVRTHTFEIPLDLMITYTGETNIMNVLRMYAWSDRNISTGHGPDFQCQYEVRFIDV